MRIIVNDIAASSGGALTVLRDFYECVKENDRENEWIFLLSDNLFEETDNIKILTLPKIKNSRFKKLIFDLFAGKKYISALNPDKVFSLQNTVTFGLKCPQIVYIHQPLPFQKIKKFSFFKKSERDYAVYQYLIGAIIKKSAKKAEKVIVQTEWMKKAICEQCKISTDKVVKISPNVKNLSNIANDTKPESIGFFYPTSQAVYKNNSLVFEVAEILDMKNLDYNITLTLPEEQSKANIRCIGRIPYEDVIDNYKKSTLIFPSYIETFGYPLVEAAALGRIVLASDSPFSRELLGNYENAYFFDPFRKEELAELMQKVIKGEIVRKDFIGKVQSTEDSWKKVLNTVTEERILFLTNIPSPYRVNFFNELGKKCDLTVLFEKATSSERDKSWGNYDFQNFKGIVLNGKALDADKAFSKEVLKYLREFKYETIIVADAATPTGMLAIEYMKLHKIPYYIEGDGGFAKSGRGLKEKIKKHFIKGAKGYFSTSKEHDRYYITYGAQEKSIYRYPFTSLKDEDIAENAASTEERNALRNKLGITEEKIVITVGQFIPRKGFDVLINACKSFKDNIGVYIIGGKPTGDYIKLKEDSGFKNIHFVDFMLKPHLNEYFRASDLFVLPTREDIWGLVVNEAMAQGLPVITTYRCIAGLELVENGKNGFIVPCDSPEILAKKINAVLCDDELKNAMSAESLKKISNYTFSKMADTHLKVLR